MDGDSPPPLALAPATLPALFAIDTEDPLHPIDLMAPTTRSSDSPNSPSNSSKGSGHFSAQAAKARRRQAAEIAYVDSVARERTKRGCWTCRIRRKSARCCLLQSGLPAHHRPPSFTPTRMRRRGGRWQVPDVQTAVPRVPRMGLETVRAIPSPLPFPIPVHAALGTLPTGVNHQPPLPKSLPADVLYSIYATRCNLTTHARHCTRALAPSLSPVDAVNPAPSSYSDPPHAWAKQHTHRPDWMKVRFCVLVVPCIIHLAPGTNDLRMALRPDTVSP